MNKLNDYKTEVGIAFLMTLLLGALVNPWWMPMGIQLVVILLLVVLFGFLVIFVWREQGGDERDQLIRHKSDRYAFLVGASLLGSFIVVETIMHHHANVWCVIAFGAMILTKALAHIYVNHNN